MQEVDRLKAQIAVLTEAKALAEGERDTLRDHIKAPSYYVLARIREILGVGAKPDLVELPIIVKEVVDQNAALQKHNTELVEKSRALNDALEALKLHAEGLERELILAREVLGG